VPQCWKNVSISNNLYQIEIDLYQIEIDSKIDVHQSNNVMLLYPTTYFKIWQLYQQVIHKKGEHTFIYIDALLVRAQLFSTKI